MTICPNCKLHVADLYAPPLFDHRCPVLGKPVGWEHDAPVKGSKCGVCGSTAIDHTENQCQLNRALKKVKKSNKSI